MIDCKKAPSLSGSSWTLVWATMSLTWIRSHHACCSEVLRRFCDSRLSPKKYKFWYFRLSFPWRLWASWQNVLSACLVINRAKCLVSVSCEKSCVLSTCIFRISCQHLLLSVLWHKFWYFRLSFSWRLWQHVLSPCLVINRAKRFMVYGLWFMVHGLWFMVYGLWFMVYGSWFMVYGLGWMRART